MMQTTVPKEHQRLGRQAKGFDRKKWDERKSDSSSAWWMRCPRSLIDTTDKSRIVEEGNYHKFTKCKESVRMAQALLETGERELVEVSRLVWHPEDIGSADVD